MAVTSRETTAERLPWAGISEPTEGKRVLRWFERVVWHDREVCSHCFAPLRQTGEVVRNSWGHAVEVSEFQAAAEPGFDKEDPPASVASAIPLARERTTCGECGSVGGLAQSDTLAKHEATDRVPALIARLEALGHAVDTATVYQTVEQLKSDPDRADDDKRIFATAAGCGIKHARR